MCTIRYTRLLTLLFLLHLSLSLCENGTNGCLQCGQKTCSQCMDNYFLQQNEKCAVCDKRCKTCQGEYYDCTSCYDNYWHNEQMLWCYSCQDHCKQCLNNTYCEVCDDGLYFTSQRQCSCSPKTGNCSICTNLTCTQCIQSYYLSDEICYFCSQGCLNCTQQIGCQKCQQGNYIVAGECRYCGWGCTQCTNDTHCEKCDQGYVYVDDYCGECQDYYCQTCHTNFSCIQCFQGYYLVDQECVDCGQTCKICKTATTCSECFEQFRLFQQNCIICDPNLIMDSRCNPTTIISAAQDSNSHIVLIVSIVCGFLFLIVLAVLIYKFCIKKAATQTDNIPPTSSNLIKLEYQWIKPLQNQQAITERRKSKCSICLQSMTNFQTQCGHRLHIPCLLRWRKKQQSCPICRNIFTRGYISCNNCLSSNLQIQVSNLSEFMMNNLTTCNSCLGIWKDY